MEDEDNEYPRRAARSRPSRGEGRRERYDDDAIEDEEPEPERPRRRAPAAFYEDNLPARPPLPANGALYSVLAGVCGGIVAFLVSVAIAFINSPLFQREIQEGKNMSYNTALAVFGVQCLSFLISLCIYAVIGFVVGRLVVQRKLGFIAGAIAGAIVYGASFLTAYIPGYPGTQASSGTSVPAANAGAITTALVVSGLFLLITALLGALMALLGAWIATRRHPYYFR